MKKFILLVLSVFAFLLVSCSFFQESNTSSTSTVSIVLPEKGRGVFTMDDVAYYDIVLCSEKDDVKEELEKFTGGTASFDNIESGKYRITVTAFSDSDIVVATGASELFVLEGGDEKQVVISLVSVKLLSEMSSAPDSGRYYVTSADDLRKISDWSNNDLATFENVTFILHDDISITDGNWTPIGPNQDLDNANEDSTSLPTTSIYAFAGTFDGNGHCLTLPVKRWTVMHYRFAQLMYYNTGTVKNLRMKATVPYEFVMDGEAECNYGSICIYNNGSILNCENYVSITGGSMRASNEGCGGIAARNNAGAIIKNCANYADFSVTYTNHDWINNYGAYRENGSTGGIAGNNFGTMENCVNYGRISISYPSDSPAVATIGAIVGTHRGDGFLKSCYWLKDCMDNPRSKDTSGNIMKNEGVGSYVDSCTNILGCGSIDSSTITGGISVYKQHDSSTLSTLPQTLAHGSNLVSALNGYVSEDVFSQLKSWKMVEGKAHLDF